ncbi:MAG: hypothetical protein M1819_004879 [Sarea resinae]|nr:MAG: hypothetical protein M1819_004879 [Sarea resinae]
MRILNKVTYDAKKAGHGTLDLTLKADLNDSEHKRAAAARHQAYMKIVPLDVAKRESRGQAYSDLSVSRHNINVTSLLFEDKELPTFDEPVVIEGTDLADIPQKARPLNEQQKAALQAACSSARGMLVVNRPLGTSKSQFLSQLALLLAKSGKRVLISSVTNEATNAIAAKIVQTAEEEDRQLVNVNSSLEDEDDPATELILTKHKLMNKRLALARSRQTKDDIEYLRLFDIIRTQSFFANDREAREFNRLTKNLTKELYEVAMIVCSTTAGANNLYLVDTFDPFAAFLDESAHARDDQALNAFVWFPRIRLLVFAGDPRQLPPFLFNEGACQGNSEGGKSIHERLETQGFVGLVQLCVQHRMEGELVEFISDEFYQGSLITADHILAGRPYLALLKEQVLRNKPPTMRSVTIDSLDLFFNVKNGVAHQEAGGSTVNPTETSVTITIILILIDRGVAASDILVLSAYDAQRWAIIEKIRRLASKGFCSLLDVHIRNIDRAQGIENKVVLFCTSKADGKIGFLGQPNQMNVALSQAQYARFVIGSWDFWTNNAADTSIGRFCEHIEYSRKTEEDKAWLRTLSKDTKHLTVGPTSESPPEPTSDSEASFGTTSEHFSDLVSESTERINEPTEPVSESAVQLIEKLTIQRKENELKQEKLKLEHNDLEKRIKDAEDNLAENRKGN